MSRLVLKTRGVVGLKTLNPYTLWVAACLVRGLLRSFLSWFWLPSVLVGNQNPSKHFSWFAEVAVF